MQTGMMRLRELTVRYEVRKDHEGQPIVVGRNLGSPKETASALMTALQDQPGEVFAILCVSTKLRVIAYREVQPRHARRYAGPSARGLQGGPTGKRRGDHPDALCGAPHNAPYVSEIVMWPWPMGAADHTGRPVDLSHITDWLKWGLSSSPFDREEIVLEGYSVRTTIGDPSVDQLEPNVNRQ